MKELNKKIIITAVAVVMLAVLLVLPSAAVDNETVVDSSVAKLTVTVDDTILGWGYQVKVDQNPVVTPSEKTCVVSVSRGNVSTYKGGSTVQILVNGTSILPTGWYLTVVAENCSYAIPENKNRVDVDTFTSDTARVTITAHNDTEFTVTFDAAGGEPVPAAQKVKCGGKVTEPADPVRAGYTFGGWYNGSDKWDFAHDAVYGNMMLTAKWLAVPCTVTFEPDNGSASWSEIYEYGEKIIQPEDPIKTGYLLEGWYYNSEKWDFDNDVVKSDMTLTAHWTPVTYSVRFNANGGSGSMDDQQFTYDEKKQLTLNTFTRNMYSFQGWAVTPNGDVVYKNGEIVMNLSSVQDDVVNLYAVWKYTGGSGGSSSSAVSYCLVQFEPFTGQEIESQWLKEGSLVQRPEDPVNAGFVFGGWYTEEGKEWDFATDKVYYSMTLYAKWAPEKDTPVTPGSQTTETTASSPIGVAGILAGLGAAAVLGLRRK